MFVKQRNGLLKKAVMKTNLGMGLLDLFDDFSLVGRREYIYGRVSGTRGGRGRQCVGKSRLKRNTRANRGGGGGGRARGGPCTVVHRGQVACP